MLVKELIKLLEKVSPDAVVRMEIDSFDTCCFELIENFSVNEFQTTDGIPVVYITEDVE